MGSCSAERETELAGSGGVAPKNGKDAGPGGPLVLPHSSDVESVRDPSMDGNMEMLVKCPPPPDISHQITKRSCTVFG